MNYSMRRMLELVMNDGVTGYLQPPTHKKVRHSFNVHGIKKERAVNYLWHLRRKNLISYQEKGDSVRIILTEEGKKRVLQYKLDDIVIPASKKWDKRWRIVAFDIPEKKKVARNALSRKMKEIGLLQFQKSLWIYPFECRDEIDFISEVFEVGRYVHYIIANEITNDKLLRRHFNL